jgi:ABC-2 type transport system ATP-binding protein
MNALELVAVTKDFGATRAVHEVSFALEPGSLVGLLGRNGAGKSTTLKMIAGLLKPTLGRIEVLGRDVARHPIETKRDVGAMPEEMALLDMLSGPQYLRFVARMYGLDTKTADARAAELMDRLELQPPKGTVIADYSFGMKKKLALSSALIHSPKLVVLDEPFEGIDTVTSRTIKDLIALLQARGVTVVLTTHVLEIVEALCPRVAIIEKGRLVGFGPLEEVKRTHATLEGLFLELVGGHRKGELSWL